MVKNKIGPADAKIMETVNPIIPIPLGINVLLEVVKEKEKQSLSGIIIPDEAKEKKPPILAIVRAIGLDVVEVAVGNEVIFAEYGFDPVEFEGKKYQIGPVEKVLAITKYNENK